MRVAVIGKGKVVLLAVPGQAVPDVEARAVAEGLIGAVGLEPAFVGDATATTTVDALLPLWFALVKLNGGNRGLALRIVR
jgi:8-hydroxy-5-deazaflavin:NADPH oxidoreductase